jgi:hypothetical protein
MLEQLCDSIALLEEACGVSEGRPMPSVTLTFPAKADAEFFAEEFRYRMGRLSRAFIPLDKSLFVVRGVEIRLRWEQPEQKEQEK